MEGNGTKVDDDAMKQALAGNHEKALALYHKALRIEDYDVYALDGVAIELYHFENYTGAVKYADMALFKSPLDMTADDVKGLALDKLGDYMGALKTYNDMFNYNENNSGLLNDIGVSFYHDGDYSDALLAHNAAIFVNKTNEFSYYNRALDLEALGDKQGALKSLDIAFKLDPTDKFAIKERQSLAIGDRNNHMR